MPDTDTEPTKKKIPPEFVNSVKKYLEVDNLIRDIKDKVKILNTQKKENEELILNYLQNMNENNIDVSDGKLKRNITKSQKPMAKEFLQKALTEATGDSQKAQNLLEHVLKSRPIIEKISLRRIKYSAKNNNESDH